MGFQHWPKQPWIRQLIIISHTNKFKPFNSASVQNCCLFNLNNTIGLVDFNILFAGKDFLEIKTSVSSKYWGRETSKDHLAVLDIFLEPSDGQLTTAGLCLTW